MFRNYLITSLRSLRRHAGFSMLNIAGLAVGLASCALILLFVRHEMSYDRFHENADRLVRVYGMADFGTGPNYGPWTASPLGDFMRDTYPEVEAITRVLPGIGVSLVRHGDQTNYEENIIGAEPDFFRLFDFEMSAGDPETALSTAYTVVVTPPFARRYFGDEDPVGRTLDMEYAGKSFEFTVTGVVESPPSNSHLQFDAIISYETYPQYHLDENGWDIASQWTMINPHTYVLLGEGADWRELSAGLPEGARRARTGETGPLDETTGWFVRYSLQPVTDIHLGALGLPVTADADLRTLKVFSLIAMLVLVIACINYMNLATARASKRAREIGVRKVFGARRKQLAFQFLAEALLLSLMAAGLAVLLMEMALPVFSDLTDGAISSISWADPQFLGGLLGAALFAGLVAGSYPAAILSGFSPMSVLRGAGRTGTGSALLRKGLVVVQFTGGIALVLATLVVYRQMDFIQNKDLGFDHDQIVSIPLRGSSVQAAAVTMKEELGTVPGVRAVAVGNGLPDAITGGNGIGVVGASAEGFAVRRVLAVDPDYDDVLGMELVEGRWFDPDRPTDQDAFVINESAVSALGLEEPLGTRLNRNGNEGPVIGVVKDFHFASMHQPIEPLFIHAPESASSYRHLILKLEAGQISGTLARLEESWARLQPGVPFSFSFLDERLDQLYAAEVRQGRLFGIFAGLGIFVACLGLFGLAAFTAELRTREIGVRKVLGASVASVVTLLSKDFLKLVVTAFLLAAPLAWYLMGRWLEDFAYRVELGWGVFALTAALAVAIALATVGWQALRAALADPVDSLRYE